MKTPPFKGHPAWTTARFWSFVRAGLRAKFNKWPPKWETYNNARRVVTGKRHKYEYQCAKCKQWWKAKEVEIDHIKEIGSLKDFSDLPRFTRRLFCSVADLQVLCIPCHRKKTQLARSKK